MQFRIRGIQWSWTSPVYFKKGPEQLPILEFFLKHTDLFSAGYQSLGFRVYGLVFRGSLFFYSITFLHQTFRLRPSAQLACQHAWTTLSTEISDLRVNHNRTYEANANTQSRYAYLVNSEVFLGFFVYMLSPSGTVEQSFAPQAPRPQQRAGEDRCRFP